LNAGYRFVTEEPGARGRRRLQIDEESLSVLHSIYYAWSAVACETGVSSIPNDFTEAAGVESTIANSVGPSNTFSDIPDDDLCSVAVWSERFSKICQMQGRRTFNSHHLPSCNYKVCCTVRQAGTIDCEFP
ncbi:hypothetical protein OS493_038634, partial [Desmophyllum pertusum]